MDRGDRIAANLAAIIRERGYNNRSASLAAGLNPTAARDIISRKSENPKHETLAKLARVLGTSVEALETGRDLKPGLVAIAGKVGAGARVPLVDAYEKGDGPQVECPPQLSPHGIVAVEVEGDSMEPVYSQGDLLFYSRDAVGVPDEAIGARCVCEDMDGDAWVKQVKPGRDPGTFDLHSINTRVDPMWGVRLKWAARVRLHLPADLARKVG